MKATIVGLVTPHVLKIIDLANKADAGVNIDWHLRDAVATSVNELASQYNAQTLLSALIQGLEATAQDAARGRKAYADTLRAAAAMAARELKPQE